MSSDATGRPCGDRREKAGEVVRDALGPGEEAELAVVAEHEHVGPGGEVLEEDAGLDQHPEPAAGEGDQERPRGPGHVCCRPVERARFADRLPREALEIDDLAGEPSEELDEPLTLRAGEPDTGVPECTDLLGSREPGYPDPPAVEVGRPDRIARRQEVVLLV